MNLPSSSKSLIASILRVLIFDLRFLILSGENFNLFSVCVCVDVYFSLLFLHRNHHNEFIANIPFLLHLILIYNMLSSIIPLILSINLL